MVYKLLFSTILSLSVIFSDFGNIPVKSIDSLSRDCESIDNQEECYDMGCDWIISYNQNGNDLIIIEECIQIEGEDTGGDDEGWEDECSEFSQDMCDVLPFCSWSEDLNQCVRDNQGGDDGSEEGCVSLSQDECVDSLDCEWMSNDVAGVFGVCVESGGVMDDGGWNDDGGWEDECSEFPQDMCDVLPFCSWSEDLNQCVRDNQDGDDGSEEGCVSLSQDECVDSLDCEWFSDNMPSAGYCGDSIDGECDPDLICGEMITCWEDGLLYPTTCGPANCDFPIEECDNGDSGIPECLQNCEGIESLDFEENPEEACDWIISALNIVDPGFGSCFNDCDDQIMNDVNEVIESCYECLQNENIECYDIFNNDENQECNDIDNPYECTENPECEWSIISADPADSFGVCLDSDPDDGGLDDGGEVECDPNMICGQALTCYDNLLYPTTCGPDNCDDPIEECDNLPDCIDGEINNDNPCNPMECYDGQWFEIIIDCAEQMGVPCEGGIYVAPPEGVCCSTCVEYGDAVLRLGHVVGNPGAEVVVPLFLDSSFSNVGGLQFTVKALESDDIASYVIPSGIISMEDCFTADFNNLDGSFIGIVFSLEGCSYEAGNNIHIADLVYELLASSESGNDAELVFENTIVSDTYGTELPSSGQSGSILIGMLADVNGDGNINVIDVVLAVSFAISVSDPSESEFWASDINQDGMINVLDIVQLVSIILESDNSNY